MHTKSKSDRELFDKKTSISFVMNVFILVFAVTLDALHSALLFPSQSRPFPLLLLDIIDSNALLKAAWILRYGCKVPTFSLFPAAVRHFDQPLVPYTFQSNRRIALERFYSCTITPFFGLQITGHVRQ